MTRVFFETATQTISEFSQLGTDLINPGGYLINVCQPARVLGVVVGQWDSESVCQWNDESVAGSLWKLKKVFLVGFKLVEERKMSAVNRAKGQTIETSAS